MPMEHERSIFYPNFEEVSWNNPPPKKEKETTNTNTRKEDKGNLEKSTSIIHLVGPARQGH